MAYTPRTTAPSGDLRWTNTSYGGYNNCIVGSPTAWSGSVLANCTGYVHGRWMELGNTNSDYNLSLGNANSYYGHSDGYSRGREPKLGAILCLGGGSAGHVAIVEEILENGDIMCSESNYGRTTFEYVRRYKSTGYMRSGGTVGGFQGFIYHPNLEPKYYTITCNNCTASTYSATQGTVVTITATIPSGYQLTGWSCSGVTVGGNPTTWSFTQPATNVTVTAVLTRVYNITCNNCYSNYSYASAGTTITITAKKPAGYKIFKWSFSGVSISVSNKTVIFTFTMPSNDVTITCETRKIHYSNTNVLYGAKQVYKGGIM